MMSNPDTILLLVLLLAAGIDLRWKIIPNSLVYVAIASGGVWLFFHPNNLAECLLSATWMSGVLFAIRQLGAVLFRRPGMGFGDVKLGFVMGLWQGYLAFLSLYLSIVGAGIFAALLLRSGTIRRQHAIPFAPFLLLGFCTQLVLPVDLLNHG